MRLEAPYEMAFQMAPAAMYDGNTEPSIIDRNRVRRIINHEPEEGAEPCYFKSCFDEKTGKPWRLAWWYTSIPGATYSEGGDLSCAMFFPPDQMDGRRQRLSARGNNRSRGCLAGADDAALSR